MLGDARQQRVLVHPDVGHPGVAPVGRQRHRERVATHADGPHDRAALEIDDHEAEVELVEGVEPGPVGAHDEVAREAVGGAVLVQIDDGLDGARVEIDLVHPPVVRAAEIQPAPVGGEGDSHVSAFADGLRRILTPIGDAPPEPVPGQRHDLDGVATDERGR